jgi:hypothetical protein
MSKEEFEISVSNMMPRIALNETIASISSKVGGADAAWRECKEWEESGREKGMQIGQDAELSGPTSRGNFNYELHHAPPPSFFSLFYAQTSGPACSLVRRASSPRRHL